MTLSLVITTLNTFSLIIIGIYISVILPVKNDMVVLHSEFTFSQ